MSLWTDVSNLSADRRTCLFRGFFLIADFDLTPESLDPLRERLEAVLARPSEALLAARCTTINIGLYDGGNDIRAWPVTMSRP